jgi:MYXO-CTERM domain-containing protein
MGVASTSACTSLLGDFTTGQGAAPDGGGVVPEGGAPPSSHDASVPEAGDDSGTAPATIAVMASDVAVYLGQTATVTASAGSSPGATFVWTVTSAPTSSGVTTASLTGPATATASFVPDVAGTYVLHAVAQAGAATGSHDVHVTAAIATVFYGRFEQPPTGSADAAPPSTEAYYAAGADGNKARAVTCPTTVSNSEDPYHVGVAFDFWEPPAGQPYKFAAFYPVVGDGGTGQLQLVVGTSDSTCASPPAAVGIFDQALAGLQPSFSADGSRVAFYDDAMNVVTIGSDGTDKHAVTSYLASEPDGSAPIYDVGADSNSSPPRLQWTKSGSLAWARSTATGWQIVTAPDQDGAPVTDYMDCLGVTPHQIAMLSDGTVIAAYRPDGAAGAENLFQLKLDPSKDCAVVHAYTALTVSDAGVAGFATDFSVSPDEKQIVYAAVDATSQSTDPWLGGDYPGGYVYVVPVDGSSPPSQVTSDASLNGPRWISGGSAIAYTRIDSNPYTTQMRFGNLIELINHPPTMSVRVVAASGGASRVIDYGDGTNVTVSTAGNGGSCSTGRGTPPGFAGLLSLAGVAYLARRRRRS